MIGVVANETVELDPRPLPNRIPIYPAPELGTVITLARKCSENCAFEVFYLADFFPRLRVFGFGQSVRLIVREHA